ncbi:RtcB family protein [Roseibacillus ishigakijimensis]|uniref:3'-phosphate/5'-hydroxy nucleic acid ligase n=1 Tax=Roseibacillus ishigakijimensis TaxID=454146 RepID=A0A934VN87_9BACT|nr:RtcB family protein [Roseibacillus ishigakijimensis]MBK1834856.1 RtcB family protein [Roseibacillus ishigakijimensis]
MKTLKKKDLIEAGWPKGPQLEEMMEKVRALQERGVCDRKYLFKLLSRDFGAPEPKVKMRERPAPFSEAIRGESKEEKENVAAVRKKMEQLMKVPVIARGAVMPDACPTSPRPAVIPVGGVIAVENAIIPSAHSADICCSLFATFYEERSSVANELDSLTTATRFGPGGRHYDDLVPHPVLDEDVWDNPFLSGLRERGVIHIADQGDGNHFAFLGEVTVDEDLIESLRKVGYGVLANELAGEPGEPLEAAATDGRRRPQPRKLRVLVTHHGSRSIGSHLYKRGQGVALKHTAKVGDHVPEAGAWLDARSSEGRHYWEALQYVSRWTKANHEAIHERFLERIGAEKVAAFGNEHNFVWQRGDLFLHGKGATPAWKDAGGRPLLGLIPLNMAEPILMVLGRDNEEFLSFAPHGAGRNISRTKLMRRYPDAATRRQVLEHHTQGIDVRWFCGQPDLSESPVAYKDAEQVRAQIAEFGLAEIVAEIRPLGCIMAGSSGRSWKEIKAEELTPKQKRQIQHRADRRRTKQDLSQWED